MPRAHPLVAFCRNLPRSTEDIKWGKDLVFSVGDKMFACFNSEQPDKKLGMIFVAPNAHCNSSVDSRKPARDLRIIE